MSYLTPAHTNPNELQLLIDTYNNRVAYEQKILRAREDFHAFCELMAPMFCPEDPRRKGTTYKQGPFTRILCAALQQAYDDSRAGMYPRLVINVPPRHGKSLHVTQLFPAWCMGRDSQTQYIVSAYNTDLALNPFSMNIQAVLKNPLFQEIFPGVTIDPSKKALSDWLTTNGCSIVAAGIDGAITGRGGHVLILDDPYKNWEEGQSATTRRIVNDAWDTTYSTRLYENSIVILVQTRWHMDDLAGRFLRESQDPPNDEYVRWRSLVFRALADTYEYYGHGQLYFEEAPLSKAEMDERGLVFFRAPGEALHPEHLGAQYLKGQRAQITPQAWASLYQQAPIPTGGTYFDPANFKYYGKDEAPDLLRCNVVTGWDFALKDSQKADNNVAITVAQDANNHWYVLDVVTFKGIAHLHTYWPEVASQYALTNKARARQAMNTTGTYTVAYEDHNIYKAKEYELGKIERDRGLVLRKEGVKPIGDKVARSTLFQVKLMRGEIYLPGEGHDPALIARIRDFVIECAAFTGVKGGKDDRVDAMATAAIVLDKKRPIRYEDTHNAPVTAIRRGGYNFHRAKGDRPTWQSQF